MNTKKTSREILSLASNVLNDKNASAIQRKLAGSALSQSDGKKQTGSEIEDMASMVLRSDKYNELTKVLAGSVLSQSNKER